MLDYDRLAKEIDEFIDSIDTEFVNKWLKERNEEIDLSDLSIEGKKKFNNNDVDDLNNEKRTESS